MWSPNELSYSSQEWKDSFAFRVRYYIQLVGGFKHFIFSIICGIILPIDFHIFQKGRYTTNHTVFYTYQLVQDSATIHSMSPPMRKSAGAGEVLGTNAAPTLSTGQWNDHFSQQETWNI